MIGVGDLRVEHLREPLGVWTPRPRFSWLVTSDGRDVVQSGYELELLRDADGAPVWRSGWVASSASVLVPLGGQDLPSSTRFRWRVRVIARAERSDWAESVFETSLLHRSEWIADFVEPEQAAVTPDGLRRENGEWVPPAPTPPEERLHPAKLVRQEFELADAPVRARLYATAHGVYSAELNGAAVGDEVLAPGYESYHRRLSFQSYDVTSLLTAGRNVLGVVLGDGWYAGRIDFTGTSAQYGDRLQAGWQLHVDHADGHRQIIVSDASAVSTDDGPIRYSDLFIGERYDARRIREGWSTPAFDATGWTPVRTLAAPGVLTAFRGEPVRRVAELAARDVITTPGGDRVIDFGQVIAGRVRMTVEGPAGTTVTLEHTESLDANGNYFNTVAGLHKDQTDHYVLSGGNEPETWEPLFSFHGFRYVRVTGYPGEIAAGHFRAIVIGSDLEVTGEFACSDPRLNQLHHNAVWSQRGNFLSIPTDCPQRERMGWTGDLQVFAPAATRNMQVVPFLSRWLDNVRADQEPDGLVPVIVPAPPFMHSLSRELKDDPLLSIRAAAGWGDAVVLVPWVLYERSGDLGVLEENYDAMQKWVERQIRVAETELPKRLRGTSLSSDERERQGLLWNTEPNFGDWLAPSVMAENPSLEHLLSVAERSGELIAAMFHGWSLDVLADAAAALGRNSDEGRYRSRSRQVRRAFAEEYVDPRGRLPFDAQGAYVLALALGFIPDDRQAGSTARLVELIHEADDHLNTGFLSVPHLLDVLWDNGHRDLAHTLLWQSTSPSWLYEVDRGATTIWEAWEGIKPDGEVTTVSFNHYAFGCVDDWLYGRLAGIQPASAGYQQVRIEPDFDAPLTWVQARQDTPYGPVAVRWDRAADDPESVTLEVRIPPNASASVVLPDGAVSIGSGTTTFAIRLDEMAVR